MSEKINYKDSQEVVNKNKCISIYEHFEKLGYTKEETYMTLFELSEEEQDILILKYGNNFNTPKDNILSEEDNIKFSKVILKINGMLIEKRFNNRGIKK